MRSKNLLVTIGSALAGLTLLTWYCPAQGPDKTTPGELDLKTVRSYAEPRTPPTAVNFNKALKLPWSSLKTIGSRLHQAEQCGDPVAMAHAASELSVAEKVSGKKAAVTATSVLKDSAKLAKLRKDPTELKAVQQVAKQIHGEKNLLAELQNDIAQAEDAAAKQDKAATQLPPQNPVAYSILIENYTDEPISVFMNGRLQLTIQPSQKRFLAFMQQPAPVVLHAYSVDYKWGPRNLYETMRFYTWVLLQPKKPSCCCD